MVTPVQPSSNVMGKLRGSFSPTSSTFTPPLPSFRQQPPVDPNPALAQSLDPAPNPIPTQVTAPTSSSQQLDVLDTVLRDIEQNRVSGGTGVLPQALPTALDQVISSATPQPTSQRTLKESVAATSLDQVTPDVGTGLQVVEHEKNPEIPVEVEAYLQHVEDHADQAPQEIVIADPNQAALPTHVPKQSVVVLPITPDQEKTGAKKVK